MSDFLLELHCEEIPARMQAKARADLEKLFTAQLKDAGLEARSITTYSTPRRLALIARGLPTQTEAVREERKGPRADAPEQALAGFLRSTGLSRDDLVEREVKGKAVLFAIIEKLGQPTTDILAEAIPAIIAAFPWPKSQRWGEASISSESLRWVRPLSSIIALLDGEVVDCEVHGIKSGRITMGHRFHSEGIISISDVDSYMTTLLGYYVNLDHGMRAQFIRGGAQQLVERAGLELVSDHGLVIENAGLTEWPVPLLGRFDEAFLDVPEEVIQLTTRINQKYFVVRDKDGALTNAFVCTANIHAIDDGRAIVAGNEKVLAARLADAKFFWELDQKTPLAVHAEKLSNIVFHEKLGTLADKVERVAKLARWLCEEGIVRNAHGNSVRHAELGSASLADNDAASNETLKQVQGDEVSVQGDEVCVQGDEVCVQGDEGGVQGDANASGEGDVNGSAHNTVNNSVRPEPVEGQGVHASTSSARTANKLADLAEQAARLCKADLVTEMVGEFPELQGLMGGYYARAEGKRNGSLSGLINNIRHAELGSASPADNDAANNETLKQVQGDEVGVQGDGNSLTDAEIDMIADAIRDHYKPVGQSDDVPSAPVTVAVSLADKLDTLYCFFAIDEKPTGSKDPFALRRAAWSVIRLIIYNQINVSAIKLFRAVDFQKIVASNGVKYDDPLQGLYQFLIDRLKVQQKEAGVRHDLIDAVFALGGEDDLVRLLDRVRALQDFVTTDDGVNLLAGYKRASNILKKEGDENMRHAELGSASIADNEASSNETLKQVQGDEGGVQGDGLTSDNESSFGLDSRLRGNDEAGLKDEDGNKSVRPEPVAKNTVRPGPVAKNTVRPEPVAKNTVRPEPVEGQNENGLRQAQPERKFEAPSDEPEQSIALQEALNAAEPKATAAIESEDFAGAMRALASLRTPIDDFFDNVMVNDADTAKKKYRLGLLSRFRDAVHRVADFSKIEG